MPKKWLSESEAFAYLAARVEGRLATCSADGQPYITPLNYVFHRGSIYFHSATEGHKLANIKANDRVCFEVSQTDKMVFSENSCGCATRFTSVVVFGRARFVAGAEEKTEAMNTLMERFAAGRPYQRVDAKMAASCCVVAINVDKISGKRNVDPPSDQQA